MAAFDEFIDRVVSQAGRLRSSTRKELERELRSHFEDAMEQARADASGDLSAGVRRRFGDPEEIGRELERVHRFERRIFLAADAFLLLATSVITVATLILLFQLAIAISLGVSLSHAFPRLRGELVGILLLALGYMSLYLEEWRLKRFRLSVAFTANIAVFACLFALAAPVLHLQAAAPGIAFIAGSAARILQKTSWRRVWFCGTVIPVTAACLNGGRLLSAGAETPLWAAVLVRWIGLTIACYFLTLLARNHELRSRPTS